MKTIRILLFFTLGIVFILGIPAQTGAAAGAENGGFFTGLSAELNNHNNDGLAIGGGLIAGYAVNDRIAVGLRTSYFHDLQILSSLEPNVFFRYTLPLFENAAWLYGFFVQAELGTIFYFYRGDTYPAFSGGLALGWRHLFDSSVFIEPVLRFGYPHMWGAGITVGYAFPRRSHE